MKTMKLFKNCAHLGYQERVTVITCLRFGTILSSKFIYHTFDAKKDLLTSHCCLL